MKSETNGFKYISGTRLMERWGLDLVEMRQIQLQEYEEKARHDIIDFDEDTGEPIIGVTSTKIIELVRSQFVRINTKESFTSFPILKNLRMKTPR